MSGLQKYVKGTRNGRPESPHQGQPKVNQQRALQAANLKVAMRPEVARPGNAQGLHGRGGSITQNQSASLQQQHLQRRPSGEGQKRDPYDTDAESIDTTVNHSIIQVEDTQLFDQQQSQPDVQEDESGEDEEGSDEDESGDDRRFPDHVWQYLADCGYMNASYDEQIQFLQQTQPHILRTVDGDSYPTTTDGNPTEVDEQQEQSVDQPDSLSPSPQRLAGHGQTPSISNQQHQQRHRTANLQHANLTAQQTSRLYQQGSQIRGQQRLQQGAALEGGETSQERGTIELPTSQPPTYSQTTRGQEYSTPSHAHARPDIAARSGQDGFPQQSMRFQLAPERTQNAVPRIVEPAVTSKRILATHTKIVPIVQQPVGPAAVDPSTVEELPEHAGDYEPEVLHAMKYEELRDESFDKDPRENEPVLPEGMCEKPLDERLQFAQQELDPSHQARFFSTLPTAEWEEAGDWFLDQFSAIIMRTRAARQKKRKEAQNFEKDIDKRHQHVAKKQRMVKDALAKMQAQGEGLVPKSPRVSKSPRPRRD
ncbi:hypothetical protein E8E12_004163 [Didymella heteroderae]|uniref:Extracellular mutant protein 11 C-terminal domain-containing protein n=1 Tax=Didymella heteroderae TaxID=1769908 RepID=A0A9P4WNT7_9PLEO|nr:hypothetical protein E8E12_004163 [Didymella heteroderae]